MKSTTNDVKNWANKFPFGFKEFAKGMSNENRIAIAGLLMEKDEFRFSEIQELLSLKKSLLSLHLKILLKYGIIRRTKSYWTAEEKVFKSKYKLNPIYRKLINENIQVLKSAIQKYPDLESTSLPTKIAIAYSDKDIRIEEIVSIKQDWLKQKNAGERKEWKEKEWKLNQKTI